MSEYQALDDAAIEPFGLVPDDLEGMDIYGPAGEQIGEVEDLLADATGEAVAVSVDTEGFLGIGDKEAVVPIERLQLADDRFTSDLTEKELEAMPEWDD